MKHLIIQSDGEGGVENAEIIPFKHFPIFTNTWGWIDSKEEMEAINKRWIEYDVRIVSRFAPTPQITQYARKIKNILKLVYSNPASIVIHQDTDTNINIGSLFSEEQKLGCDWNTETGETDFWAGTTISTELRNKIIKIGKEIK